MLVRTARTVERIALGTEMALCSGKNTEGDTNFISAVKYLKMEQKQQQLSIEFHGFEHELKSVSERVLKLFLGVNDDRHNRTWATHKSITLT